MSSRVRYTAAHFSIVRILAGFGFCVFPLFVSANVWERVALVALSLVIAIGFARKWALLAFGVAWGAVASSGSDVPLVFFLSLVAGIGLLCVVPAGEPLSLRVAAPSSNWKMPSALPWIARGSLVASIVYHVATGHLPVLPIGEFALALLSYPPTWGASVSEDGAERVVYFDGVCGICNRTVDFLLAADALRILRFAPLQGDNARSRLPDRYTNGALETFVYARNERLFERSDASLAVIKEFGGLWTVVWLLAFVPRPARSAVYDLVAKRRYDLFGRRETCRAPLPEEKERFLV